MNDIKKKKVSFDESKNIFLDKLKMFLDYPNFQNLEIEVLIKEKSKYVKYRKVEYYIKLPDYDLRFEDLKKIIDFEKCFDEIYMDDDVTFFFSLFLKDV